MELNIARPYIETSGQMEEQMFSIQDQGMIFDILRNKMYSNNILAICREISCNARDAHREVGKDDVPIEITLPNHLEPFYKIKDFGPGISPDRMANVFIKYTASTKRGDNVQTGGFGLGAKTPFAYSDTFTIVTNVDGTQYNYACFIDETRVGKLVLLNTSPTDDINGTEIIIPVKVQDFRYFSDWTELSTRHWSTLPVIRGDSNFRWFKHVPVLEGKHWSICQRKDNYNKSLRLIIDAIEYPLEFDSLRKYANVDLINAINGDLHLYFSVGELTLSANREQVYLDDATKLKIKSRLDQLFQEVKANLIKKINDCENLWQANLFFKTEVQAGFSNVHVFGKLKWRTFDLSGGYAIDAGCNVFKFSKGSNRRGDPNKVHRHTTHSIAFEKDSLLYVNDLPLKEPTPKHVKKIFEDNPDLKSVQLVCPTDKVTIADLNTEIALDQMAPQLLSTVTKASARAYKPSSARVLVFKFEMPTYRELGSFKQISYSEIEEDTNTKLLMSVVKESYGTAGRVPVLVGKSSFGIGSLSAIAQKFPNLSIYGLDPSVPEKRIEEDFSDFLPFEEFIKEKLEKSAINFVEIKFAATHSYDVDDNMVALLPKIKKLIDDPNSLYLKKSEVHQRLKTALESQNKGLLGTYESLIGEITDQQLEDFIKNNPDYDFQTVNDLFVKKYPILQYVNTYQKQHIVKEIAQYINLLDKV